MSKVIPKEQLTAYQRWELAAFEDAGMGLPPGTRPPHAGEPRLGEPDPAGEEALRLTLPTAEDLERIHQEAWQEGYTLGLEEGRKAGFETGRQEGEKYVRQLRALAEALESERVRQDEAVAQEVLALALAVSQQLVGTRWYGSGWPRNTAIFPGSWWKTSRWSPAGSGSKAPTANWMPP